tara:strand:- start:2594 stop:3484 length:891 start_codon:yes stop_codon:yes gene_type:complete
MTKNLLISNATLSKYKHTYTILEKIQFLSIDVVIGAVAVGYMATRLLEVVATPMWWLILPMAVWVTYSLDHIVDSVKNKNEAVIDRHRFHYANRKPIIVMIVLVGLVTILLSWLFLDDKIIIYGIALSIIIGLYFALLYFLNTWKTALLQKELIIAGIYTSGIFLAPLVWYGGAPPYYAIAVISSIFVLVWFEGIMISWFDYDNDIKDGHTSFTVIIGRRNTRRFLIVAHMLLEIMIITALILISDKIAFYSLLIALIMNLLLGLIIMFPHRVSKNNYYRLLGEVVFFLPVMIVLV